MESSVAWLLGILEAVIILLLSAVWWGVNRRIGAVEARLDRLLNGGFVGALQERATRSEVRLDLIEKQRPCMAEKKPGGVVRT